MTPPDRRSLPLPLARTSALLLLAMALVAPAAAQPAARVADLTTSGATGSSPSQFTRMGGVVFFRAGDEANGSELWRTDGTPTGTRLVKDLFGGPGSSNPDHLTVVGDRLFFAASNTLWKSDGTAAGTVTVRADLRVPLDLVALDGLLYFTVESATFGRELWRTDGTPSGTWMVKDILPGPVGSYPWYTVAFEGALYFGAVGPEGDELWTSDGTEAGTVLVRDIVPGPENGAPLHLTVAGGTLFFHAFTADFGREVWTTDGTGAGTVVVRDIAPGGFGQGTSLTFAAVGDRVVFGADDGVSGDEPWVSDGTLAGTLRLRDIRPGVEPSYVRLPTAVGSAAYFTADDGTNGREVWRTDLTPAGTVMLGAVTTDDFALHGLTAFDGALFFSTDDGAHGQEPWRADGTALTLLDLNPGPLGSAPVSLTSTGDALYFGATPVGGEPAASFGEPWRSDGTLAGSQMLAALDAGASSAMSYSVSYDGAYYFLLNRPETGYELWKSDGTEAGTALFIDLLPGPESGFPQTFLVHDGFLYFSGRDTEGAALFRTDGRAGGTAVVKRFPDHVPGSAGMSKVSAGGRIFLAVSTTALGLELWTSDGTEAGTVLVRDLNPGPASGQVGLLSVLGDNVVFRATASPLAWLSLWRSDGTAAGTVPLTRARSDSFPLDLTAIGARVFYSDADAVHGREPWVTDGTPAGTVRLADLTEGPGDSGAAQFTPLGAHVLFTARSGPAGYELWRTDGTPAGTTLLADILPGPASSSPGQLAAGDGFVFFSATDGVSGHEPWRTDGTAGGTTRLADLVPGAEPSMNGFGGSGSWGGLVFFPAAAPGLGTELWRTDGTAAGTRLVQDIGPGEHSAGLDFVGTGNELTPAGGLLFFRAVDSAGREPWSLLPELSVGDGAAEEGGTAAFTVTLSPAVDRAVTVAFATADGSATAGADYVPASGTLTFAPGESAHAVVVSLLDDARVEGVEHFTLSLSAPSGAFVRDASGLGSIADGDGLPWLSVGDAAVVEGDTGSAAATFVVTRMGSAAAGTTVSYASGDGTALAGDDFVHVSGTLTFAPGVTERTVAVTVLGDALDEPDERFLLEIGPASGAQVGRSVAFGTIRDDDGGAIALREVAHGSLVRASLPASPSAEHLYLLVLDPYSSYEIVLDEASGDLGDAGPQLQHVAAGLTHVVKESAPVGVGPARSLRLANDLPVSRLSSIRVRSAGCSTDCGVDDTYRLRVRDTTARIARFNAVGGQTTVVLLQNSSDVAVTAHVTYWTQGGATEWTTAVAVAPHGVAVVPVPVFAVGDSGSLTVAHDGPHGALAGKAVALEPATGLAFDTPMDMRPR